VTELDGLHGCSDFRQWARRLGLNRGAVGEFSSIIACARRFLKRRDEGGAGES
jgi:hypothetical protein